MEDGEPDGELAPSWILWSLGIWKDFSHLSRSQFAKYGKFAFLEEFPGLLHSFDRDHLISKKNQLDKPVLSNAVLYRTWDSGMRRSRLITAFARRI